MSRTSTGTSSPCHPVCLTKSNKAPGPARVACTQDPPEGDGLARGAYQGEVGKTEDLKALIFDEFGTVVDWRSSVIREGEELGRKKVLTVVWAAFADINPVNIPHYTSHPVRTRYPTRFHSPSRIPLKLIRLCVRRPVQAKTRPPLHDLHTSVQVRRSPDHLSETLRYPYNTTTHT